MRHVIDEFEVIRGKDGDLMTLTFSFSKAEFGEFLSKVEDLPDITPEYDLHESNDLHVHFLDEVTLIFNGAGQSIKGDEFMLLGVVPNKFKGTDEIVVTLRIVPSPDLQHRA